MSEPKRAAQNEKVVVNRDFSISVPEGYLFSTDKNIIKENRAFVFIKDTQNEYFVDIYGDNMDFSLTEPFSAPQCVTVNEFQDFGKQYGGQLNLADESTRNTLKNTAIQFLTMFGGEATAIKETDDVLVYYSASDDTNSFFAIVTSRFMYHGQIFINDVEDAKERSEIAGGWLNSVEGYTLTDADKVPSPPFVVPAYVEGKREMMGSITVAVPDHMKTLQSEAADASFSESSYYANLMDEFAFVAVNKDFQGGFRNYQDAGMSIHARNDSIQQLSSLAMYWEDGMESERKQKFLSLIESNFAGSPYVMHYAEPDDHLAAIYIQSQESEDNIEQWAGYFVLFVHDTTLIQVNIYINAVLDKPAMDKAVEDWVKAARVSSDDDVKEFKKNKAERELGSYAAEDGQIDAVKTALLFSKDVIFHHDGDIVFENGHHVSKTVQVNSGEIDNYPEIKDHLDAFGPQIQNVLAYVEQNENLMIPKELCHENVYAATGQLQITGMTIFSLCAFHALIVGEESEDSYLVLVDRNLVRGVPAFADLMGEFIQTLRAFNGKNGRFQMSITSAIMADSPIEAVDEPVLGAQTISVGDVTTVEADEHPFTGVCDSIQDLRKTEKSAQSTVAEANDKQEWDVQILSDATLGIYAYNGTETEIEVPEKINGIPITRICRYAFSPQQDNISEDIQHCRESITKVCLPETIQVIEEYAFDGCSALNTILLNDGLQDVGESVFAATALKKITFPESVTHIGPFTLTMCLNLENVVFPSGACRIDDHLFSCWSKIKDLLIVNNGTELYYYPGNLTEEEYTVPNGVTSIRKDALECAELKTLILSDTVSSIDINVFNKKLKKIIMPEQPVSVEFNTFSSAKGLSETVYSKNMDVLYFCPSSVKVTEFEVPESVTTLSPGAFYENEHITDIYLSEYVSDIGNSAFNTWNHAIRIHAPEQSYVENYVKKENNSNLIFVANGVASVPYEEEEKESGGFDLSALLGLLGLGNIE